MNGTPTCAQKQTGPGKPARSRLGGCARQRVLLFTSAQTVEGALRADHGERGDAQVGKWACANAGARAETIARVTACAVHPHNDGQHSSSHGTTGNIEIRGGKKWARADTDAGGETVARVNACAFSPPRMAARVFRTGDRERGCADRHKWARAHADARGETVVRVTACAFSTPRKDKGTLRTGNN